MSKEVSYVGSKKKAESLSNPNLPGARAIEGQGSAEVLTKRGEKDQVLGICP